MSIMSLNDVPFHREPPASAGELVDVIDDQGRTVGVVTRGEMRRRRLPHRCVYVLVFNRHGDLFLHLRTASKDVFPSHWDIAVGGVLAADEAFDAGAVREMNEELGITADLTRLFEFRYADEATVVHGMVYRTVHDGPFRLQPEEVVRGEFLPLAEVLERSQREKFCPDGLAVLAEYLRSDSLTGERGGVSPPRGPPVADCPLGGLTPPARPAYARRTLTPSPAAPQGSAPRPAPPRGMAASPSTPDNAISARRFPPRCP
jgi:isopentenyldiphosphate isomerase